MLQNKLHVLINERQLRRRMTTNLLKMRRVITGVDAVWNDSGTTNIRSVFNKSVSTRTLLGHQIGR